MASLSVQRIVISPDSPISAGTILSSRNKPHHESLRSALAHNAKLDLHHHADLNYLFGGNVEE
jgi:hypothetical protein